MKRRNQWALAIAVFLLMSVAPADAEQTFVTGDVEVVCDNVDTSSIKDAREPIVTHTSYDRESYDRYRWETLITVYEPGDTIIPIGAIEFDGLTTPVRHDNWFGSTDAYPIDGRTITAIYTVTDLYAGIEYELDRDTEHCPPVAVAPPVIVDPAPTPAPPAPSRIRRAPEPEPVPVVWGRNLPRPA